MRVTKAVTGFLAVCVLALCFSAVHAQDQPIIDHENNTEFAQVDAEWGFMIAPKSGIAGYIRPGIGIGAARPFDYNLEFAIKFVWR
jgi:hypothetical protein